MKSKDKAASALLAVFPTPDSFRGFAENTEHAVLLNSFTEYAFKNGIISKADGKALESFIQQSARTIEDCTPPSHLTFEELLDQKGKHLELDLSVRAMTDRINALIADNIPELPKVSNSMLTRLKIEPADTAYKHNVLRSLAFWIGHERAEMSRRWNFETLLKICSSAKKHESFREGVRIGFALYSRGDVIDHEIMGWLKKMLRTYMEQAIGHFVYGQWGKVRSHDFTTLYIDFPREEMTGGPASFQECLRSAVSLAHQIAIQWILSDHYSKNRFMSIGIVAGEYGILDNHLQPLMNAKLTGDPLIRVSDYVRQCLLISDIRVILCQKPVEITLYNNEVLAVWWLTGLWSTFYFDFVRDLLQDRTLANDAPAVQKMEDILWPPVRSRDSLLDADARNAVSAYLRFPHNSLLGIEIAKTLFFRRRFHEAIDILRIVLSIDPVDITARTLRMVLFRTLALDAPSYLVAKGLYDQAEEEANYIRDNCTSQSEDFYCEYAVLYLTRAMSTVRSMRKNRAYFHDRWNVDRLKQEVFSALDKAEQLFIRGVIISPSGIRSSYLLNSVRVLRAILMYNEDIFTDMRKPIDAPWDIVRKTSEEILIQTGLARNETSGNARYDFLERLMTAKGKIHDDSISLQAYRPSIYFCRAVAYWDFVPVRTALIASEVLSMLDKAREIAEEVEKDNVCIYSFSGTYAEMTPAREFSRHMDKAIRMIREVVGKDLSSEKDDYIIETKGKISHLLMTLDL